MEIQFPQLDSNFAVAFEGNYDLENHLLNLQWKIVEELSNLSYNSSDPTKFLQAQATLKGRRDIILELLDNFDIIRNPKSSPVTK